MREPPTIKKRKGLDEDIQNTFNEVKLPERQKTILRKTFLNMSFSSRNPQGAFEEDGDHEFAKDPMYEFFDSIIKTSVLEVI